MLTDSFSAGLGFHWLFWCSFFVVEIVGALVFMFASISASICERCAFEETGEHFISVVNSKAFSASRRGLFAGLAFECVVITSCCQVHREQ